MRIEIAHRAIEFGQHHDILQAGLLALQAPGDVCQLLAERGRAGRLAMCARKHGKGSRRPCHHPQSGHQGPQGGRHQILARTAQDQGIGNVVDVLGSAGEVHEWAQPGQLRAFGQPLVDEVFHCLDIVIGGFLDGFDATGLLVAEVRDQPVEPVMNDG